ncbi:hypothetical protein ACJO5Y_00320 [Marinobacter sp. GN3S48]|uniref:hypothetical protein n=1 Tax=Marinobacter sp. GN3S48 TaxID=3382302 RepID=UPI00387B8F38
MTEASKALIIWLSILALAISNGLFREAVPQPAFGAPSAFVLSGLLLSALIIGVAWVSLIAAKMRRKV